MEKNKKTTPDDMSWVDDFDFTLKGRPAILPTQSEREPKPGAAKQSVKDSLGSKK